MDSTQDTIASTPIKDSFHIDIEKLKTKPKLQPKDFPTRKAALAYAEECVDSLLEGINELESNMVFLDENPSPSESKRAVNNSLDTIWEMQDSLKELKGTEASK